MKEREEKKRKKRDEKDEGDEVKGWGRYGDILLNKNQ